MTYISLCVFILSIPFTCYTSQQSKLPGISFSFSPEIRIHNNNTLTSTQQQTLDPISPVGQRLLELAHQAKQHKMQITCGIIGAGISGFYLLLLVYIMRNKNWIHYNDSAWHNWRSDVSIEVLKQIQPNVTAQELWKAIQNKYPGKQAGELLILFITETSQEIDRLSTFIESCDTIDAWYLSSIIPSINHSKTLALEKLSRLYSMQHSITSTVANVLTM